MFRNNVNDNSLEDHCTKKAKLETDHSQEMDIEFETKIGRAEIIDQVLDYKASFEQALLNSPNFKKEMDVLFDEFINNLLDNKQVTTVIEESLSTFVAKIEELLTRAKQSKFPQSFLHQEISSTIEAITFLDNLLVAQNQAVSEIGIQEVMKQWRKSYIIKCSPKQLISALDNDTQALRTKISKELSEMVIPQEVSNTLNQKVLEFIKIFNYIFENSPAIETTELLEQARIEILVGFKDFLKTPLSQIWKSSPDASFCRSILNKIESLIREVHLFEQSHAQRLELPRMG